MDDNNKNTAQLLNSPTGMIINDFPLNNIFDYFNSNNDSILLQNKIKLR